MKKTTHTFGRILSIIPGLIILAFGCAALFISSQLVKSMEEVAVRSQGNVVNISNLQQSILEFDNAFHQIITDKSKDDLPKLFEIFVALERSYGSIAKIFFKEADRNSNTGKNFLLINTQLQNIRAILDSYLDKQGGYVTRTLHPKHFEEIHDECRAIIKNIKTIQQTLLSDMKNYYSAEQARQNKTLLYVSIILVGGAGFFLVVLSNFRLTRQKELASENTEVLERLQVRQAAIDASHDGLMIVQSDGCIGYMNEAMGKIAGICGEECLGIHWSRAFGSENEHKIRYDIAPQLTRQGYWRGRFTLDKVDGKAYTELSVTRLDDGGFICSLQDITQEYLAREEKSALEDQFFQAQKMEAIGRLAGGVAHDFNNILAAMNGYAEFLSEDLPAGSQSHKFAQNILLAGRQARDLVDRMLMFSRRSDRTVRKMDVLESVRETALMLKASLPRSVQVNTDIRIKDGTIMGNPTQISQILMNLCVNAKDAMDEEQGILTLRVDMMLADDFPLEFILCDELDTPNATPPIRIDPITAETTRLILGHLKRGLLYVTLRVQDTGSGMSRAVMEHIFEPFFTTKAVDKGTGLGLATVHGVVTSHDGAMVIESTIGAGTSFEIYLPFAGSAQDVFKASEAYNAPPMKAKNNHEEINVLLVEDQDHVRDMMMTMLERLNCKVEIAEDGLLGLKAIRECGRLYDLVITDHNMPRMSGVEMVQQVQIENPEMPFILFSGYSQKEIEELQRTMPSIKAVLRKPVTKENLAKEIDMIMAQKIIVPSQNRAAS